MKVTKPFAITIALFLCATTIFAERLSKGPQAFDEFHFSYGLMPYNITRTNVHGGTAQSSFVKFRNIITFDFYTEDTDFEGEHTEISLIFNISYSNSLKRTNKIKDFLDFKSKALFFLYKKYPINDFLTFKTEGGSGLGLELRKFSNTAATNFLNYEYPFLPYPDAAASTNYHHDGSPVRVFVPFVPLEFETGLKVEFANRFESYSSIRAGMDIGWGFATGASKAQQLGLCYGFFVSGTQELRMNFERAKIKLGVNMDRAYDGYLSQMLAQPAGSRKLFHEKTPFRFNAYLGVDFGFSLIIFE